MAAGSGISSGLWAACPAVCATWILRGVAIYLAAGLATFAAYFITGKSGAIEFFFRVPGAMAAITMAILQLACSFLVCRQFAASEPMGIAWQFISLSAACEVAATLANQIFATNSILNPLRVASWWSEPAALGFHQFGFIMEGSLRFALLALGLFGALRVYRRSGFLGRLTRADLLLLALGALYVVWEFADVGIALQKGKRPGWTEMAGWPVDPLLWVLLLEALWLYRSVRSMGSSRVGRCWMAFSAGIGFVLLGDILLWASAYGYVKWPWSALEWYVWLPAGAAFALAPAYQLDAIRLAVGTPPLVQ